GAPCSWETKHNDAFSCSKNFKGYVARTCHGNHRSSGYGRTKIQSHLVVSIQSPFEQKHTNRLAREKSPYLLQHQHNPVDWFAWGEEAFSKARAEDKPIFLSIGYSTCHWCHVME